MQSGKDRLHCQKASNMLPQVMMLGVRLPLRVGCHCLARSGRSSARVPLLVLFSTRASSPQAGQPVPLVVRDWIVAGQGLWCAFFEHFHITWILL